jgi:copper chaperone
MNFNVPKMSCGHCTAAIEKAITAADPNATVACDLETHRVSVASILSATDLGAAIKDAGYDAERIDG